MSENVRQKRIKILDRFEDKYIHRNIQEVLVFFLRYFPTLRC